MTYGQIKLQLQKQLPGVDLELIEGWIQGRYTRILDSMSWKRQEAESVIQAPFSYAVGTLTATQGSVVITSDDLTTPTVFTAAMDGRTIRIGNTNEYYQFTYVSPTVGNLDRGYEGPDTTAASYRIDQAIFLMPSNARIIRQVTPLHNKNRPLDIVPPSELNRLASGRTTYGTPQWAAATWDNFSDPPQLQLELYPIPDCPDSTSTVLSWAIDYIYEEAELDSDATTVSLKPFVRPACLMEGVKADAMRPRPNWAGDLNAAMAYETEYEKLLGQMQMINAQQRGPQYIQLADNLKRRARPRYGRGPRHVGWPG
jgi:hypothetical protein